MTAPDVYEELGRMAQAARAEAGKNTDPRFEWFVDGLEEAQHLVEFLRWRDAREEWPAEGCACLCVFEWRSGGGYCPEVPNVMVRSGVSRWRYILGPCSCVVRATGPEAKP